MFKYLMFRAIEDILMIFNDAAAVPPLDIRKSLRNANTRAAPLWRDEAVPFIERQAACREILNPVIKMNTVSKAGNFKAVPFSIVDEIDNIFRHFYSEPDLLLLIGRTDERAYKVQDKYGRVVATLLGTVDSAYESRAITRLRKAYGRGALPLLSMSSASGIWQLCRSSFYKKQIYLVSPPSPPC
jgi:hypothetical protein